jgi:hypothetical protein
MSTVDGVIRLADSSIELSWQSYRSACDLMMRFHNTFHVRIRLLAVDKVHTTYQAPLPQGRSATAPALIPELALPKLLPGFLASGGSAPANTTAPSPAAETNAPSKRLPHSVDPKAAEARALARGDTVWSKNDISRPRPKHDTNSVSYSDSAWRGAPTIAAAPITVTVAAPSTTSRFQGAIDQELMDLNPFKDIPFSVLASSELQDYIVLLCVYW